MRYILRSMGTIEKLFLLELNKEKIVNCSLFHTKKKVFFFLLLYTGIF